MKSIGKENKLHAADPISDEELGAMYSTNVPGPETPSSLLYSMRIICTLHVGMRTVKETRDLNKGGDIHLKLVAEVQEYLVYSRERQIESRTGMNPSLVIPTIPRAYAVPEYPRKDHVALINKCKNADKQTGLRQHSFSP